MTDPGSKSPQKHGSTVWTWNAYGSPLFHCAILQALWQASDTTRLPEKHFSQDAPLNELPLQPRLKSPGKGGCQNKACEFIAGVWLLLAIMLLQLGFCFRMADLEPVPAFSSRKFPNRCLPSGSGKREACFAEEAETAKQSTFCWRCSAARVVTAQFLPRRASRQS